MTVHCATWRINQTFSPIIDGYDIKFNCMKVGQPIGNIIVTNDFLSMYDTPEGVKHHIEITERNYIDKCNKCKKGADDE